MLSGSQQSPEIPALSVSVREAIASRYSQTNAERFGIGPARFEQILSAVIVRYAADAGEDEQLEILAGLRLEELVLARACSDGNEAAWDYFLTRYRATLYEAAYRIAHDDATARELADGLYGDLYGIPGESGQRRSKLDYYMGRGSLEGWLRTVLSQQYIDKYRARRKDVSLEEQVEAGASFAAKPDGAESPVDERVTKAIKEVLQELSGEDRFLLASYYLDQRTLADIGRHLRVHESTISRKLERLTRELRKRLRKRMEAAGINRRRCEEILAETDVRDLNVEIGINLKQDTSVGAFYKKDGSAT